MILEETAAEVEAVKAVFADCIEEPAEGLEATRQLYVNVLPDTGGVQVFRD